MVMNSTRNIHKIEKLMNKYTKNERFKAPSYIICISASCQCNVSALADCGKIEVQ